MKSLKILASALSVFFTIGFSNAQTATTTQNEADNTKSKSFSFGIKGGVNFTNIYGNSESQDYRTSFHAGLLGELPVSDMFSVQGEVLYSGQGFNVGSEGLKDEYQLDYINVPILAKMYVVKSLSIEVGPQFSYLINEKVIYDSDTANITAKNTSVKAKNLDFAVAAGLTLQTSMGLFVTGRYSYGFTPLYDADVPMTGLDDIHNVVLQLSLGYKF